ncbi:MAG: alanine/ornithine racemase family PLP-dependent enzyme [Clostridia bacterium]|nr:alanine/ornithine racemase family PLP-dependent enzyme [Clostridia bacterium]
MNRRYPSIEVNLTKIRYNMEQIVGRCKEAGISVAGVIKGANGIPEIAGEFAAAGCAFIASSRLEQLENLGNEAKDCPKMLIRIPMKSEADDVVALTQISLNSDVEVLYALDAAAGRAGKSHKVILMADLGDLREGFWYLEELVAAAMEVENKMPNLELAGIGTNLGCYGSIEPTQEKMEELIKKAEIVEQYIGRRLEYISGGATTSLMRVFDGNMPERINLLRIGEGVLNAYDLPELWKYDCSFLYQDAFTLKAEVIEMKEKPSYPQGKIGFDAFGNTPEYEDRGFRKRALAGVGKLDFGDPDNLIPRLPGAEILGASSDHLILDVQECPITLRIGAVLEFDVRYPSMLFATASAGIRIECVREDLPPLDAADEVCGNYTDCGTGETSCSSCGSCNSCASCAECASHVDKC